MLKLSSIRYGPDRCKKINFKPTQPKRNENENDLIEITVKCIEFN